MKKKKTDVLSATPSSTAPVTPKKVYTGRASYGIVGGVVVLINRQNVVETIKGK